MSITLQTEVETKNIAHAYLFCGPRGIGKTSTARIFAKAVNCLQPKKGEPCTVCENCVAIQEGRALDLIEIDGASNRRIDEARDLRENVRFLPSKFPYKVYIIDEVHMLTTESFNALLKTLEEPPKHAIFILATTEVNKLPKTIISRCQRFDFSRASIEDLVSRLQFISQKEGREVSVPSLKRIARAGGGSMRDAEGILGKIFSMSEKKITEDIVDIVLPRQAVEHITKVLSALFQHQAREALMAFEGAMEEGVDADDFLKDTIEIARKLLLLKSTGPKGLPVLIDVDIENEGEMLKLAELVSEKRIITVLDRFIIAQSRLKLVDIPQLPVEMAIVELAQGEK